MKKTLLFSFFLAIIVFGCTPQNINKDISIIPQPSVLKVTSGYYTLEPEATIAVADTSLNSVAQYLAKTIENANGLKLIAVSKTQGDIVLSDTLKSDNPEAYTLQVNEDGIRINGASPAGVIMAISTLQQLLPNNSYKGASIANLTIQDAPRFAYRGLMLDVSRHFYTIEQVKDLLNVMARYKLNKFHWHLTDDQGWRVEIKKYPLLTEKGAWRKFNNQDRQCQQYEKEYDNPDFAIPTELMKVNGVDTLYGGFYTQEQIKDVVRYAAERGIDILPEVDMPGHLMGAILGYPEISCKGVAQWGASFSDPLCVGKDSAMSFAKDIYTEIAALFPYEYMHLGADEVEKTNWKACPNCQKRMRDNKLKNEEQLQAWFVKEMEKHFNSLGKKLIGWDEVVDGGLSENATIMWWRNWAPYAVPQATKAGNKAIISPCFTMYFDAWESKNTLQSVYEFDPILPSLDSIQAQNILGVQANLWCETIPNTRRMYHQYFPRVLALAEVAWGQNKPKNWDMFMVKVQIEVDYLNKKGINYRIPDLTGFDDINVFTERADVVVKSPLKDVVIRFTTDGTFPNSKSKHYVYGVNSNITKSTNFIFRAFRPDGTAGEMYKAEFRKESYSPAEDVPNTKQGLKFRQYEFNGNKCSDIENAPMVGEFVVDTINMGEQLKGWIGLVGTGYIDVPDDGIYTISLMSNDGSRLFIDDKLLIDNDNPHGDKTIVAQKALGKGLHMVRIEFFEMNNGGSLVLKWKQKQDDNFHLIDTFCY